MRQIKIIITLFILVLAPCMMSAEIVLRSIPNYSNVQNKKQQLQRHQQMNMPNNQLETLQPHDFSTYRPFGEQTIDDAIKTGPMQYAPGASMTPGGNMNGGAGRPPIEGAPISDVILPLLFFIGIYLLKLRAKK